MIRRGLSPKNKYKFNRDSSNIFKLIPDRWQDFARLCDIRSGSSIVKFNPYPYQVKLVEQIERSTTIIICKSRQLGITETIVNYMLYKCLQNKGFLCLVLSKTQNDTSNLAKRVRRSVESLNEYTSLVSNNLQDLEFSNGGRILFRNSKPSGTRGLESVGVVLIDEMSFIENIEEIYTSVIPTTNCVENPHIILLSTPNGRTGLFFDILNSNNCDRDIIDICSNMKIGNIEPLQYWTDDVGISKFLLHWLAHPKFCKQDNYLENIRKKFGLPRDKVAQEYDLSFSDSESIVFSSELISKAAIGSYDDPNFEDGYYYAGLDTSTVGDNYTVFTLVKKTWNGKLILEFIYRERNKSFQYHIDRISEVIENYQPHSIAVESNSGGAIFLEKLSALLLGFNFIDFKTTERSKQTAIDRLLFELENENLILPNDAIVIDEFQSFKRNGKKLAASNGKSDDVIMSTAIYLAGIASLS